MTTPTRDAILAGMVGEFWAFDRRLVDKLVLDASVEDLRREAAARSQNMAAAAPVTRAVIPITGVITRRASLWSWIFGGTSTVEVGAALTAALDDKRVKEIVLLVDSPGGTVAGVADLAAAIRKARTRKPITAFVELAASAAYWLAAQAGTIVATQDAIVGSIGVFSLHLGIAGALAKEGIRPTFMSAPGPEKVELSPLLELTDEARKYEQGQIDELYRKFVAEVADGRTFGKRLVTRAIVREKFGGGRTMLAPAARAVGMIDAIGTLDELLNAAPFQVEREARARAGLRPPTPAMERAAFDAERRQRLAARQANPYESERARRAARRSTPTQHR